jgi:hypothetical protein
VRKGLVSCWAAITFFVPAPTPAASTASGIAARYPGDKGIQNDPSVILFDDFESYTDPSQLKRKWSGAGPLANLRIATEPGDVFAGRKSLEMTLPISTSETINRARKKLATEQTRIYFRAYMKWDPGYSVTTSGHNGLRIAAHYPGGAGISPARNGTGFFSFMLQNNAAGRYLFEHPLGYSEFYVYWPLQRTKYGDHWYPDGSVRPAGMGDWLLHPHQYPDFKAMPNWQPERGKWYCIESMVKANTVGKRDGEAAFWVNGVLKGRFPDLFLRSIDSLKIDDVELRQHALHSEQVNKKWYDNVVIATQYIGPMTGPSARASETTTATGSR